MDFNNLFPFIVGIVFVCFVACFCFILKRIYCAHPRHQNNEASTATLKVKPGQKIVFQPRDVLTGVTAQQPMMASFKLLDEHHIQPAADSNDDPSIKIFFITISELDPFPPSYQEVTKPSLRY